MESDNENVSSTTLFTDCVYKAFCADCIVENSCKQPIFIWTQSPTKHIYSRGISRFTALQVKKSDVQSQD